MSHIAWNPNKNTKLKTERGIDFGVVLEILELNEAIITPNPSTKRLNQHIAYFEYKTYYYACPFVIDIEGNIFLKTIYPSRKAKKIIKEFYENRKINKD